MTIVIVVGMFMILVIMRFKLVITIMLVGVFVNLVIMVIKMVITIKIVVGVS